MDTTFYCSKHGWGCSCEGPWYCFTHKRYYCGCRGAQLSDLMGIAFAKISRRWNKLDEKQRIKARELLESEPVIQTREASDEKSRLYMNRETTLNEWKAAFQAHYTELMRVIKMAGG